MRQRTRKRPIAEINVVPYIDVMLVLLIIFMITAPLLSQGVNVDLPKVPSQAMPPTDKEPVVVSVDAAGNFYINYGDDQDKPIAAEVLANRINALKKYQPEIPVFVKGDSNVAYGIVVQLMALLQSAGVEGVGLVTEPPEQ
jgi:biopolymer transport protein TolR